jgi:hypothetical protein
MSSKNVREVLWVAIRALITSEGTLQERLACAGIGLTSLSSENDLPKKYQEDLESIILDLTKEPAVGNEGKIEATTRKLSDQEATQTATKILGLYTQLRGGI